MMTSIGQDKVKIVGFEEPSWVMALVSGVTYLGFLLGLTWFLCFLSLYWKEAILVSALLLGLLLKLRGRL